MKAKLTATMLVCSLLQLTVANANTTEQTDPLSTEDNSELQSESTLSSEELTALSDEAFNEPSPINSDTPDDAFNDDNNSYENSADDTNVDDLAHDTIITEEELAAETSQDVMTQEEETFDIEVAIENDVSNEETVLDGEQLVDNDQTDIIEQGFADESDTQESITDDYAVDDDTVIEDYATEDSATEDSALENAIAESEANETALEDTLTELSEEESSVSEAQELGNEDYVDDFSDELAGEEALGLDESGDTNSNAYNFERPLPNEGDVYIPVLDDAKVFAEFIDSLPAVVNFYTYATEDEIIAFYSENYGEPVEQERKRGRLTIIYYLEDIATRVVISEQDNYRQVDVLQEDAML